MMASQRPYKGVPYPPVRTVEAPAAETVQPAHTLGQIALRGLAQQVVAVAHQAAGVQVAATIADHLRRHPRAGFYAAWRGTDLRRTRALGGGHGPSPAGCAQTAKGHVPTPFCAYSNSHPSLSGSAVSGARAMTLQPIAWRLGWVWRRRPVARNGWRASPALSYAEDSATRSKEASQHVDALPMPGRKHPPFTLPGR
jgi:hypothetical protein